jgi:hypothetical protein
MASLNTEVYDPNNVFSSTLNNQDVIDYFFTQRKVTDTEEYIDTKSMERKTKKVTKQYNWLALNLPYKFIENLGNNFKVDIEIWGDKKLNFEGTILAKNKNIPHLLIKLNGDTKIFIKLSLNINDKIKIFTNFIEIPKRYQL